MKNKVLAQLINEVKEHGIIEAIGDAVSIQDTGFKILFQNKTHRVFFENRVGKYCYEVYDKGDKICENCPLAATFKDGVTHTIEKSTLTKRGKEYFEITTSPLKDSTGQIVAGIEVVRNVTNRKQSEIILQESENRYRSLVESTDDSIYLVDKSYRYLFMNKKHLLRLGLLGFQFMERAYGDFHTPKETKFFVDKIDKVLSSGQSAQYEYKSMRDNKHFLQTVSPVKDADGRVTAVTVISKEITQLKEMEEKLRTLSFTDELTGLYNRRGFFSLAEQQLKIANREKIGRFLLSIDLDYLKKINDAYGHKEGDLVLLETAITLKKSFRDSDIIARIGGDEFVVLVIETPETNIETLTVRLKTNLDSHNAGTNKPYALSLSLGLIRYNPEHLCSVDELLCSADQLMYEEKKQKQKVK